MKPEQHKLISEATSALRLRNIVLCDAHLRRGKLAGFLLADLLRDKVEVEQQDKRAVHYFDNEVIIDNEEKTDLEVIVALGTRIVMPQIDKPRKKKKKTDDDVDIVVEIEASFIVQYEIISDISAPAKKVFAEFNAVHNVWPFWRQHVFDICQRGKIPVLEIPLMAGIPSN